MNFPPPPYPTGLPPPPMPPGYVGGGSLLPPPLPPHLLQRGGPPPPPPPNLSSGPPHLLPNTVLLTHIPACLYQSPPVIAVSNTLDPSSGGAATTVKTTQSLSQHYRILRDWMFGATVSGVRQVQIVPSQALDLSTAIPKQPSSADERKNKRTRDSAESSSSSSSLASLLYEFCSDRVKEQQRQGQAATAVVSFSHGDAALKFLTAFRHFQKLLQDEINSAAGEKSSSSNNKASSTLPPSYLKFQAHWIPSNPDMVLPPPPAVQSPPLPPTGDSSTSAAVSASKSPAAVAAEKLLSSLKSLREKFEHPELQTLTQNTVTKGNENNKTTSRIEKSVVDPVQKDTPALSKQQLQLQDEDPYEDDADPLNAPAVLQAVRDFRKRLEGLQGHKAVKRKAMVASKLAQLLPSVRATMQREKQQQQQQQPQKPQPAPPRPVALPLPSAPMGAAAMGQPPARGVSNLPAWITQQRNEAVPATSALVEPQLEEGETAPGEPASKRVKTEDGNETTAMTIEGAAATEQPQEAVNALTDNMEEFQKAPSFPFIPPERHEELRQFLAAQVRQYLGEEEESLIQFVHQHVTGNAAAGDSADSKAKALWPELQEILEEDAQAFLQAVRQKAQELAS